MSDTLPEGWKWRKVSETGTVQTGRQRSPQFTEGTLRPYLRVANVFDGYIDASQVNSMYFTDKEYETFRLVVGDILLNEGQSTALVGRPAIYRNVPPDCCFQNTLIRFRAGADVSSDFMLRLFQYCLYSGKFAAISSQTTSIAHLGLSRFASLRISLPTSRSEQDAIANILESASAISNKTNTLLNVKIRYKDALAEDLLTARKYLPEFPEREWSQFRLGDLFAERIETRRGDLTLLSVTGNDGVVARDELTRRDTSNEDKSKYLRVVPGDIAYNTMRMWQGVCGLSSLEGLISPAYTVCVPNALIDGRFAAHLFKTTAMINEFRSNSQGLVKDTLNLKYHNFARIKVSIPALAEQRQIASFLSLLDDEIRLLRRQRDILKKQRQELMQLLLTGQVRVPAFRNQAQSQPNTLTRGHSCDNG